MKEPIRLQLHSSSFNYQMQLNAFSLLTNPKKTSLLYWALGALYKESNDNIGRQYDLKTFFLVSLQVASTLSS